MLHQSLKSKAFSPNIGFFKKKGIIISSIAENFVTLKSIPWGNPSGFLQESLRD
jgi:hypothetical protein